MDSKLVNFVYMNKKVEIPLNSIESYNDLVFEVFTTISGIKQFNSPTTPEVKENLVNRFNNCYYFTYITKIITSENWNDIKPLIQSQEFIFVNRKIKGGFPFDPFKMVISAIFSFLRPILGPIYDVIEAIVKAALL